MKTVKFEIKPHSRTFGPAVLALVGALLMSMGLVFMVSSTAQADPGAKVYVCKYVKTPGAGEVLQTGNNPIEVSVNAIPGYTGQAPELLVGMEFTDGQERSLVIAVSAGPGGGQGDEPTIGISDCPAPNIAPDNVCPPGTDKAGQAIPAGQTVATFCNESQAVVCPPGTDKAGQAIPAGQTVATFCSQIAGTKTIKPKVDDGPKQDDQPTVKGAQAFAPGGVAPPADAPTAVAAGLGETTSSSLQAAAQLLVAGGMLLLMAGAWIGLGRREAGTHEA